MNIRKNQQGISTFWGISIILMEVVVVLSVFFVLYYFWIENPTPTEDILFIRSFNRYRVTLPVEADTSGWQIYQNVTFGFSFKYPSAYTISEDDIDYGGNKGHIVSLSIEGKEALWLRIFPRQGEESIAQAYQRLTGISASTYQSHTKTVGTTDMVIFRVAPGTLVQDHVCFVGNTYFFEAPLDRVSAPIISTFAFIK